MILFILAFKLSFGQVDTSYVNGIRMVAVKDLKTYCGTTTIKNRIYELQVGATFNRTVLANGWFIMSNDSCYRKTWIQQMIDKKFYLESKEVFKKFKNGKPYSGRVREDDGEYRIIGRCRKGLPYGKFIILNSNNELIWKGEINNMNHE